MEPCSAAGAAERQQWGGVANSRLTGTNLNLSYLQVKSWSSQLPETTKIRTEVAHGTALSTSCCTILRPKLTNESRLSRQKCQNVKKHTQPAPQAPGKIRFSTPKNMPKKWRPRPGAGGPGCAYRVLLFGGCIWGCAYRVLLFWALISRSLGPPPVIVKMLPALGPS